MVSSRRERQATRALAAEARDLDCPHRAEIARLMAVDREARQAEPCPPAPPCPEPEEVEL